MKKRYTLTSLLFFLTACIQTPQQLRGYNLAYDLSSLNQAESIAGEKENGAKNLLSQRPVTLKNAISYALEHNLDAAVAARKAALKREALTGAYWRMLPSLMLSGEHSAQNHYVPSSSMSWETKKESLEPSISHDKKTTTFAAELSWDLLDLAIGFQRMQQAQKEFHISEYDLQRAKQDLVLDITETYLQCAISVVAMQDAETLITRAKQRQQVLETEGKSSISNPVQVLNSKILIYQLQDNLRRYTLQARRQWLRLAELLGVSPQTRFTFAPIEMPEQIAMLDISDTDLQALEKEALQHRPEMFRFDLKEYNALKEADIALTQLFPSLVPFARYSYDDNSYLSRDDWINAGFRLSWNLLTIPRLLSKKNEGIKETKLVRKQRQVQAQAVIVQLNLALAEYQDVREKLEIARNLEDANGELEKIMRYNVTSGSAGNETALLETSENYLQSRIKTMQIWAELMLAKARIYNSLGRDLAWQDMDLGQRIVPLKEKDVE